MIASLFRLLIVTGIILIPKVLGVGVCILPDGEYTYTDWSMQLDSPPGTIFDILKGSDETAEAFVKFAAAQKDLVGKVDESFYQVCVGENLVTYEKKFLDATSVLIAEKHADDSSGNSTFQILRKVQLIFPDGIFQDGSENDSLELHICVTGNASNAYVVAFGYLICNGIDVQEVRVDGEIDFEHPVSMARDLCYEKEVDKAMILLMAFISSKKDDIHQEDTKKDSGGAQEDLKDSSANQSTEVDSHGQDQDQHTSSNSTPWICGLCVSCQQSCSTSEETQEESHTISFVTEFNDNEDQLFIKVESNGFCIDCQLFNTESIAYSQLLDFLKEVSNKNNNVSIELDGPEFKDLFVELGWQYDEDEMEKYLTNGVSCNIRLLNDSNVYTLEYWNYN